MRVDPETGLRLADGKGGVTDFFYHEYLPGEYAMENQSGAAPAPEEVRNQLF
jgi:hypothetical protein